MLLTLKNFNYEAFPIKELLKLEEKFIYLNLIMFYLKKSY